MIEEIKSRQAKDQTKGVVERGRYAMAITGGASRNDGTESSRPKFNRFIYENLLCHVEGQIETWNRKAVREANPEAAHALRLKAEGLGYALRLLYAFKPEFDDLVASAERSKCKGCGAEFAVLGDMQAGERGERFVELARLVNDGIGDVAVNEAVGRGQLADLPARRLLSNPSRPLLALVIARRGAEFEDGIVRSADPLLSGLALGSGDAS